MNQDSKTSIFHYLENSLAARDIETIAAEQERCYEKICGLLNIQFQRKISYWLYGSPDELNAATETERG